VAVKDLIDLIESKVAPTRPQAGERIKLCQEPLAWMRAGGK